MPAGDDIPNPVRALVAEHIRSVVELECLLLLRADPGRAWSAGELGNELRVDADWAARELADLAARGLAAAAGSGPAAGPDADAPARYRYGAPPAADEAIAGLAKAYAERRVAVIELIFSPRPAAGPLRSFADAFRLRRDAPGPAAPEGGRDDPDG